jgi:hypothetical protein
MERIFGDTVPLKENCIYTSITENGNFSQEENIDERVIRAM